MPSRRLHIPVILITSVILGIGAGVLAWRYFSSSQILPAGAEPHARLFTEVLPPSPTPSPRVARPHEVHIPRLGLTAAVEHVGLEPSGRMASPTNPDNVGWYQFGSMPGETGRAVLAGHLDSETGPAVFYRLDTLVAGDQITVTGSDGRKHTFAVRAKETYATADFPLDRVFGSADTPQLNLITCGGHFNNQTREYTHRTVVYTELIDEPESQDPSLEQ